MTSYHKIWGNSDLDGLTIIGLSKVSDWCVPATCPDTDPDHLPTSVWMDMCVYIYIEIYI